MRFYFLFVDLYFLLCYNSYCDNVSFKEADVNYLNELEEFDSSVIYAYESDGKIVIEANGEGTGFVEVFTHTGDCRELIEVTVEYSVFDRIHIMFDEMIENIKNMLGLNTSCVV